MIIGNVTGIEARAVILYQISSTSSYVLRNEKCEITAKEFLNKILFYALLENNLNKLCP